MIIHREYAQQSPEWIAAHVGRPTASEFDQLVSPSWEIRKGQTPQTYLAKKVAEAWSKGPMPGFGSFATEQGKILEGEAIPWYEFEFECQAADQSALLSEFQEWNKTALTPVEPADATTPGATVRRNVEHNGVEISFPSKPDASVIARLKEAGFRWSHFARVWYKKYGVYAWAQAHTIAGLPQPIPVEQERGPDAFDCRVEDSMAEACGMSPVGGPGQ